MPEQKNFKSSFLCPILCPLTCMKKLTRPVIESKQRLAEKLNQKFDQKRATQAGGCSARVPLPSERGGLPQRTGPNSFPLPPRASRCQPQGAPALQGRGIPGPGGWKLSNLLSAKFQILSNNTTGPIPGAMEPSSKPDTWSGTFHPGSQLCPVKVAGNIFHLK